MEATTNIPAATLSQPTRWSQWVTALAFGGLVGLLAALDPWVRAGFQPTWLDLRLNRAVPWLLAALLSAATLAGIALCCQKRLFSARYELAALGLILTPMASGLNLGPLDPTDPVFLAAFLFFLAACFIEHRPIVTPRALLALLAVMTVCLIASSINGLEVTILSLHTLLSKFIIVFLLTNLIVTADVQRLAIRAFIIGAMLSALVGIASVVGQSVWGYAFTFTDDPKEIFKATPLGLFMRATALQPHAQALAHLLILGLSLALFLPMSRWLKVLCLLLAVVGVGLTFTAGGYVVLLIVLLLWPFLSRPERTFHYASVMLAALIALYLTGGLSWFYHHVFLGLGAGGVEERRELLQVWLGELFRHPLLGHGLRNVRGVYDAPVHNAYLQTAVEIGIIGGVAYALTMIYLLIHLLALLRHPWKAQDRAVLKGLLLAQFSLALTFLLEPIYDNVVSWVFMGLAASALGRGPHSPCSAKGDPSLRQPGGAG